MKSILAPLGALIALGGAAGSAAAADPATVVQTSLFSMARSAVLDLAATPDQPSFAVAVQQTPTLAFMPFDSTLGALTGAHWEIDMFYSLETLSSVRSLSTALDQPVSGIVYGLLNVGSRMLAGTGGQVFHAAAETYGGCTTTLAQGSCLIDEVGQGTLQASIAATDLSAFTEVAEIDEDMQMAGEVWHLPGDGPLSITSNAHFLALGPEHVKGELRLVYEYQPIAAAVPEPQTYLLMGLGMLAIGAWRRRQGMNDAAKERP